MASPQKENGYTQISNELLDALCYFRIPGEVMQVVNCVIRQTYGYKKKEDWIANSQLVEKTGLKKGNVSRALSKAITHNIVIKKDNKLSLNKDYDLWIPFKKVIKSETTVIQKDNETLSKKITKCYPKRGTQKKERNKESITKESREIINNLKEKYPIKSI